MFSGAKHSRAVGALLNEFVGKLRNYYWLNRPSRLSESQNLFAAHKNRAQNGRFKTMPRIYEMREAQTMPYDYVYASVSSLDSMAIHAWWTALSKARTLSEANAAPRNFSTFWFGRDRQKPDWPYAGFQHSVCSRRMWEVMRPFCSSSMGWIQLPPEPNGSVVEWGFIFGAPNVDISQPLFQIPHFFVAKEVGNAHRWPFCSEELRAALIGDDCVGIDFVAREVEQRVFGQGSPRTPKQEKGAPTK